jgi:MFS family permease
MLSIAFLIFTEQTYGSYTAAGSVLAALSVGNAVASPFTARLIGNFGIRTVVMTTAILASVTITVMVFVAMPVGLMIALGLIAGASYPPIMSAVRTMYPKLVPTDLLGALYSLDAASQEIIWIVGPVLTTFVSIQISASLGVMMSVLFFLGGGLWFCTSPAVGTVEIPKNDTRFGAVLINRVVATNLVIGFLIVASFAGSEAAIIAYFGDGNPQSGFVLGAWALGSLIGGLALGHIRITPWGLPWRLGISVAGLALAFVSPNFWWLTVTLFISGIGTAPTLSVLFSTISASVKFSQTSEAFGWLGTGLVVGAAAGAAIAGYTIDHSGALSALAVGLGILAFSLIIGLAGVRWMPDLRDGDHGPSDH